MSYPGAPVFNQSSGQWVDPRTGKPINPLLGGAVNNPTYGSGQGGGGGTSGRGPIPITSHPDYDPGFWPNPNDPWLSSDEAWRQWNEKMGLGDSGGGTPPGGGAGGGPLSPEEQNALDGMVGAAGPTGGGGSTPRPMAPQPTTSRPRRFPMAGAAGPTRATNRYGGGILGRVMGGR